MKKKNNDDNLYLDDIPVCTLKKDEIIEKISLLLNKRKKTEIITFINAHVFCFCYKDKTVSEIIKESSINCIDGISIKFALLLLYGQNCERSIMTKVFDNFLINKNIPHEKAILIGLSDEEIFKAKLKINITSNNIVITDVYSGFHNEAYYKNIFEKHKDIKMIIIGSSTPKSEHICKIAGENVKKALIWHVGAGTLMCYAGTKKRGNKWLSRLGFEWIQRFIIEKHTRKRYLMHNFLFIMIIIKLIIKKIFNLQK